MHVSIDAFHQNDEDTLKIDKKTNDILIVGSDVSPVVGDKTYARSPFENQKYYGQVSSFNMNRIVNKVDSDGNIVWL